MGFFKSFYWGTASAAYQVEGAYQEDGKGPGIWDVLSQGHIRHGESGNEACDHYHHYKEDIALMRQMKLNAYRFSISWPRVMPEPGKVNKKGLQFYQNMVKELIKADITPIVTLYHWNLPMWAHEKGGWLCDEISDDFAAFVKVIVAALSEKVSIWLTLSDPATFVYDGYLHGDHAPFEHCDPSAPNYLEKMCRLTRNVLLAHGKAVQVIRENAVLPPRISIAMDSYLWMPWEESAGGIEEARLKNFAEIPDCRLFSWWMDPILLGTAQRELAAYLSGEDMDTIHQSIDFLGFNCFRAQNYDEENGPNPAAWPGMPRSCLDWAITPDALYWAVRFYYERYRLPLMVTGNGMANLDFVMVDGCVHDPQRVDYLHTHLRSLKRAADEGYPILGYLYWSLFDAFEWAEGYDKRHGMVYVDYRTQKRSLKDSSFWYAKIIRENGENL